jgi:hypothetical protein
MPRCPRCKRDAPADALHCPACGQGLGDLTLRDTPLDAIVRLRALRGDESPGKAATLMGSGARGSSVDNLETMPDGGALAREVMARLAGRTRDDTEPLPPKAAVTPTPAPAPTPLPEARVTRPVSADRPPTANNTALEPTVPVPRPTPSAVGALPRAGEQVEGYHIEGEVGRGGMGRVYRAVHGITGQLVALKMLLPQLTADPRQMARFVNEAKVLARMEHPNLVPLLGFLREGRRAFIVMPFVEGITLERMLRKQGRLSLDVAADLFAQICDGLSCVHSHSVLHRDLKPGNVIIRGDGRVLITDFGIARGIGAQKLTLTGMVVGTAEYLSPEEARGERLDDVRSDVYSLGVLLYEMVCGHVPFRHPSAAQVLMKHVQAVPPSPRDIVPTLPEGLNAALLRSLEKAPGDRFADVQQFKAAVLAALDRAPTPAPAAAALPIPAVVATPPPVASRRVPAASLDTAEDPLPLGGPRWAPLFVALFAGMAAALVLWLLLGRG